MQIYKDPINVRLDESKFELFIDDRKIEPNIRKFEEMKKVLKSPYVLADNNMAMYYMFRHIFDKIDIRYDITYIPPKLIGNEYNKTHGHYHPNTNDGYGYPELYRIISGRGLFILQKENDDETYDVYVIHGNKNNVIFIPPGFGHVSINPTKDTMLILENLVSDGFESKYSDYEKNKGAAFYYTTGGLVQNTNYFIKTIKQIKKPEKTIELLSGLKAYFKLSENKQGLLKLFYDSPENYSFLNEPHKIIENLNQMQ